MGKQLEAAEKDKSTLDEVYFKLKQELKDKNKRVNASIVSPWMI